MESSPDVAGGRGELFVGREIGGGADWSCESAVVTRVGELQQTTGGGAKCGAGRTAVFATGCARGAAQAASRSGAMRKSRLMSATKLPSPYNRLNVLDYSNADPFPSLIANS